MEEERASIESKSFKHEIKVCMNKGCCTLESRHLHIRLTSIDQKRRIEKGKSAAPDMGEDDQTELRSLERPQRYSTTSGFGQAPSNKKTWSVPTVKDQDPSKISKKRKRPVKSKDQGTGVNAIPVY